MNSQHKRQMGLPQTCKICNSRLPSIRSLSKHIRDNHKPISIKKYYDLYCGGPGECLVCGKITKFGDLGIGYKFYCSPKHACKHHRKTLKLDVEKFQNFREKVKINQKRIWQERELTGEKQIIMDKVSKKIKETVSKWSPEKRRKKYDHFTSKTEKEKNEMIKKMIKHNSYKSDEDPVMSKAYEKRLVKISAALISQIERLIDGI